MNIIYGYGIITGESREEIDEEVIFLEKKGFRF